MAVGYMRSAVRPPAFGCAKGRCHHELAYGDEAGEAILLIAGLGTQMIRLSIQPVAETPQFRYRMSISC